VRPLPRYVLAIMAAFVAFELWIPLLAFVLRALAGPTIPTAVQAVVPLLGLAVPAVVGLALNDYLADRQGLVRPYQPKRRPSDLDQDEGPERGEEDQAELDQELEEGEEGQEERDEWLEEEEGQEKPGEGLEPEEGQEKPDEGLYEEGDLDEREWGREQGQRREGPQGEGQGSTTARRKTAGGGGQQDTRTTRRS
jgi:hypothetical protein